MDQGGVCRCKREGVRGGGGGSYRSVVVYVRDSCWGIPRGGSRGGSLDVNVRV